MISILISIQVLVSGEYLQWRQGRIDIGEDHDRNALPLKCAVSANWQMLYERKMVTLACTDYSPENNHDWKSYIGTDSLRE